MKDITVQEFICNDSECECLSRSECKRIWISDKNMSERNDLKYKNMSAQCVFLCVVWFIKIARILARNTF